MAKACLIEGKTEGINFKSKESKVMAATLMFTEPQANAILDMRLYKLIGLEIDALIKEHEDTVANIFRYEDILDRKDSMAQVIMNDLDAIKKEFSRPRRTVIDNLEEVVVEEVKVPEMDVMFAMDRFGYAKIIDVSTYERNKEACEEEFKYLCKCKNTGKICLFTNTGNLHTFKASELPTAKLRDKGVPIDNVSNFSSAEENIIAVASQSDLNLYRILFVTKQSMCKVVDGGEFDVAKRTVAATKLMDDDEVVSVVPLTDRKYITMLTNNSMYIRFEIAEIPEKKKVAVGVRCMKLSAGDYVDKVYYTGEFDETVMEAGSGKIAVNSLKLSQRDGKGTKLK